MDFAQLQQVSYHTFSTSWNMSNQVHVDFLRNFRQTYGSEPTTPLAATGYDLAMYIVDGLRRRNTDFWTSPTGTLPTLIHPLHFSRSGAGLENDQPQLYKMEGLRLIAVRN